MIPRFVAGVIFLGFALLLLQTRDVGAAEPIQLPWPSGHAHRIYGGNTYGCHTHNDLNALQGLPYSAGYYGIDFQAGDDADGSPLDVSAAGAGTIVVMEFISDGYGRKVVIHHGGGIYSIYAHLASYTPGLSPGAVRPGQRLGTAGGTGGNYDVHIHFHMQSGTTAIKAEPMSGIGGSGSNSFGWYGSSQESGNGCANYEDHDPSPYWFSRPQLGRDAFLNDGCPDLYARDNSFALRRYPGNCSGGVGNFSVAATGWSNLSGPMGTTFMRTSSDPLVGGCPELLIRENLSPHRLRSYRGNGSLVGGFAQCSGNYSAYDILGTGWAPNSLNPLLSPGDLTGDGCADVLAVETAQPFTMRLYPGLRSGLTCTGQLGDAETHQTGSGWLLNFITGVGDIDGDGCNDIVAAEPAPPQNLRLYRGTCAGGFLSAIVIGTGWTPTLLSEIIGTGDATGDGCADLMARESYGSYSLRLYPGTCSPTHHRAIGNQFRLDHRPKLGHPQVIQWTSACCEDTITPCDAPG